MAMLDSNDSDSESKDSAELSAAETDDVDVYLNYRIPKLLGGATSSRLTGAGRPPGSQVTCNTKGTIMSLTELAAQKVAYHLPFGLVEHFNPPVPEMMQCRIAFWSFPQDEDDVRLYTCLANGSADVFIRAEDLISLNCVCDMLQVGFHLSAGVKFIHDSSNNLDCFRVSITFDRCRITSCSCSCSAPTLWCEHVVAVCLQRIRKPQEVRLRAPVSESLQRLEKNQLQKFAQYLINELPQQILPAAQKLLDELLSGNEADINQNPAAPDPTAGATIYEHTSWCLDDTHLSKDIQKILAKQCAAQPTVCSDVQALHSSAPPAATEYSQLLRPIRGREPEGLWNLISIVGEMMKRRDSNFFLLLEIMTHEVLRCDKIVTWWFETKVSMHSGSTINCSNSRNNSQSTSQYSSSNFCDEIVHLWRLAALNPSAHADEKKQLYDKFQKWHLDILGKYNDTSQGETLNPSVKAMKRQALEVFPGFKSAMEGCLIEWNDWSDKTNSLISSDNQNNTDKTKSSKSGKKRKKKSKSKPSNQEPVPSTSSETNCIDINEPSTSSKDQTSVVQDTDHTANDTNTCQSDSNLASTSRTDDVKNDIGETSERNELTSSVSNQEHLQNVSQQNVSQIEQDLRVYYMDPEEVVSVAKKSQTPDELIHVNMKKLNKPLETLYAKTEGLYVHGHLEESRKLALRVATEILDYQNYPGMKQLYSLPKQLSSIPRRRKRKNTLDNQMSIVVSEALTRIAFLCNVLLEEPENHHLVFKLALLGVEMKRSPAATKLVEVKLINQKHDLVALLKNIPLYEKELNILREKGQLIRDGRYAEENDALTTLIVGSYIFEALVLSKSYPNCRTGIDSSRTTSTGAYTQPTQCPLEDHFFASGDLSQSQTSQACSLLVFGKQPSDSSFGFHVSLGALNCKVSQTEIEHPLLCEGIRRLRGDLALSLLTHYKDDQEKLDLVLKHLLDNEVACPIELSDNADRSGKKTASLQDLNQLNEASSHFMFELAKTVLDKAGGNSHSAHLFRPQLTGNGGRAIHRRLHMCTLRIALHSLGLQNKISPNWTQRTYNGRASFINEQALEIGLPAIKFLCTNWEGYLTPVEVAFIADKAGCSNDIEAKRVAAEMAKSCLKYPSNLDFNTVKRILAHCKEQSIEMLEEACNEIEQVSEGDAACSDVLFATSRAWYDLYDKLVSEDLSNDKNCYESKDNGTQEQEDYTSCWLDATSSPNQEFCQQFTDTVNLIKWDVYGRVDDMPSHKYMDYLKASYRVGIKALDALSPSSCLSSKHNPKKEDDVIWLLGLSKSLGRDYLYNFFLSAMKSITNPHVLHVISIDLHRFFGNLPEDHEDRVNILLPLIDKSLERYVKYSKDLMKHPSYDQKIYIDSILEVAQELTGIASTLSSAAHFKELLRIVDFKKGKKSRFCIETQQKHSWVNDLLSHLRFCECAKCRTGREMSVKQSKCHQRAA